MEAFATCQDKQITKHKLRLANECRLRMHVITVADLADENGRQISPHKLNGEWKAESDLKWPNLPPPTQKMIEAFRLCLRKTICAKPSRVLKQLPMKLDTPLGKWIKAPRHRHYDHYRTEEWLYKRMQQEDGTSKYMRYKQMSINASKFYSDCEVETVPSHAIPTDVYFKQSCAFPIHPYAVVQSPAQAPSHTSNDDDEVDNAEQLHNPQTKKIGVSDGSVEPITGMAAFAWILTSRDKVGSIKQKRQVNGNPKYMNSYHAELSGMVDILQYIVNATMSDHHIELWCDSESVVGQLNSKQSPSLTDMTAPESDLVSIARTLLRTMPNVIVKLVYGHQEDDIPINDLPLEAQLNIQCDGAAKDYMRELTYEGTRPPPIEGAGAILYLGANMVTTEVDAPINFAAHSNNQFQYLRQKIEWTDSQLTAINWKAIGAAKRRLKRAASIRTTKMMHEWLNIGEQKAKMHQDDTCPCCGDAIEDQLHLYRCSHARMEQAKEEALVTISKRLNKDKIPPAIVMEFTNQLRATTQSTSARQQYACNVAWEAGEAQRTLGSMAILRGHHHKDWATVCRDTFRRPVDPPPS